MSRVMMVMVVRRVRLGGGRSRRGGGEGEGGQGGKESLQRTVPRFARRDGGRAPPVERFGYQSRTDDICHRAMRLVAGLPM